MSEMQQNAGRDLFKVDITKIAIERTNTCLALLNFNVPVDHPNFDGCLADIQSFLERHFPQNHEYHLTYQVTASYYLRRPDTGEERVWTGSFVAGSEQNCSLSGRNFLVYQRDSFIRVVRRSLLPENVEDSLSWRDVDTHWQFSHLSSIIISFQTRLNVGHVFFARYENLPDHRGRRERTHYTLVNPS